MREQSEQPKMPATIEELSAAVMAAEVDKLISENRDLLIQRTRETLEKYIAQAGESND